MPKKPSLYPLIQEVKNALCRLEIMAGKEELKGVARSHIADAIYHVMLAEVEIRFPDGMKQQLLTTRAQDIRDTIKDAAAGNGERPTLPNLPPPRK